MKRDRNFLLLFAFGGYLLISILRRQLGMPFGSIASAWFGVIYNIPYVFDMSEAIRSTIATIIIVFITAMLVFSIKRMLSDTKEFNKFPVVLWNVLLANALYFVIIMALNTLISLLPTNVVVVSNNLLGTILGSANQVLYFLALVSIARDGKISFKYIKEMFSDTRSKQLVFLATIIVIVTAGFPILMNNLFRFRMTLWYGVVHHLFVASAFTAIISTVLFSNQNSIDE